MSYPSGTGCLNCTTGHKKCDQSRPTCRRCRNAGIKCEGYPAAQRHGRGIPEFTSKPNPPRGLAQPQDGSPTSPGSVDSGPSIQIIDLTPIPPTTASSVPTSSAQLKYSNTSGQLISPISPGTGPPVAFSDGPRISLASDNMPYIPFLLDWGSAEPSLADLLPSPSSPSRATASSFSRSQGFSRPDEHAVRTPPYERRVQQSLTPGQASLLDALFSLGRPTDDQVTSPDQIEVSDQAILDSPPPDHDHIPVVPEDQESVTGVLIAPLSLDRRVQSNWVPFVLQSYSLWMARFLFEPLRITPVAREYVLGGYSLGQQARWRMTMASQVVREATTTTAYDLVRPPIIFHLQSQMQQDWQMVSSSRQPDLEIDRERALRSLDSIYELVSMLVKLTPLSNVLTAMQFAAPVFRRACPDPPQELIHLPGLLVSINVSLQFYATLDILLSTFTGRPMFLRYNLDFKPPVTEDLFNLENGPGFRWLYGVPDRLVVTLAKMNSLLEDFGAYVDLETVSELEEEILGFKSVVGVSADPTLTVGRLVVQECWRQAAFIYLYMGLCGADTHDARVARAQSKFMDLVKGARPARNPDSFLIMPMIMLGIATRDVESQFFIRSRLLSLPECSRTATVGNDVVRILDDIWSLSRSARWSDLRLACLRVVGM